MNKFTSKSCVFPEVDLQQVELLSSSLDITLVTGKILYHRGLQTVEQARAFLNPSIDNLYDPFLFLDMEKAVHRLGKAIQEKEKILICGDYDVDGVTSTTILMKFLKFLGGHVDFYIPHRLKEGYGINENTVLRAKEENVKILISVDNGITAIEEAELAYKLGMEVIITDHHCASSDNLPKALAILNPKLSRSTYPFQGLCGAGVAFKLVWALGEKYCSFHRKSSVEFQDILQEMLSLAALGTVADMVPLVEENRTLVQFGLQALERSKSPGIHALLEVAGVRDRTLKITDISFKIAPLLNAAGRLGDSETCVNLLTSKSSTKAYKLSKKLSKQNLKRREMCRQTYLDAIRKIKDENLEKDPILVLSSSDWHAGLIGVVASRLLNEFYRPVVMIAVDGNIGKGSCRSIEQFPIYPALQHAHSLFVKFGGHMFAAGFEIEASKIPSLRETLLRYSKDMVKNGSDHFPVFKVDCTTDFSKITSTLIRELKKFAPYGQNNKKPLLFTSSVQIVGKPRTFGHRNSHLLLYLRENDRVLKGTFLGKGNLATTLESSDFYDICYFPTIDQLGGEVELELQALLTNFVS